jgi:hypothetical protein
MRKSSLIQSSSAQQYGQQYEHDRKASHEDDIHPVLLLSAMGESSLSPHVVDHSGGYLAFGPFMFDHEASPPCESWSCLQHEPRVRPVDAQSPRQPLNKDLALTELKRDAT